MARHSVERLSLDWKDPDQVVEVKSATHPGDWNEYQPFERNRSPDPGSLLAPWKNFGVGMALHFWDLDEKQCIPPYARQITHCVEYFEDSNHPITVVEEERAKLFLPYWDALAECVWRTSSPSWQAYTRKSCSAKDFMAEKYEDVQKCHSESEHRLPSSILPERTMDVGPHEVHETGQQPTEPGPSHFSRFAVHAARASRKWQIGRVHLPLLRGFQHAPVWRKAPVVLKEVEGAILSTP
ncbi:MAG: hypothetical protein M1826_000162 [Phylliscum demangeonii]|nr:MAG: hypothetical protein M1826_000162 [Phylliscum demangeonii]